MAGLRPSRLYSQVLPNNFTLYNVPSWPRKRVTGTRAKDLVEQKYGMLGRFSDRLNEIYQGVTYNQPGIQEEVDRNITRTTMGYLYNGVNDIIQHRFGPGEPIMDQTELKNSIGNKTFRQWFADLDRRVLRNYGRRLDITDVERENLNQNFLHSKMEYNRATDQAAVNFALPHNTDQYLTMLTGTGAQIHLIGAFPILGPRTFMNLPDTVITFIDNTTRNVKNQHQRSKLAHVQFSVYKSNFNTHGIFDVTNFQNKTADIISPLLKNEEEAKQWLDRFTNIFQQASVHDDNADDLKATIELHLSYQPNTYVRINDLFQMLTNSLGQPVYGHIWFLVVDCLYIFN